MRTLVDIPDSQIKALAELCERGKQPRAAMIRDAIADYLAPHRQTEARAAFGLWSADAEGGLADQDRLRAEW